MLLFGFLSFLFVSFDIVTASGDPKLICTNKGEKGLKRIQKNKSSFNIFQEENISKSTSTTTTTQPPFFTNSLSTLNGKNENNKNTKKNYFKTFFKKCSDRMKSSDKQKNKKQRVHSKTLLLPPSPSFSSNVSDKDKFNLEIIIEPKDLIRDLSACSISDSSSNNDSNNNKNIITKNKTEPILHDSHSTLLSSLSLTSLPLPLLPRSGKSETFKSSIPEELRYNPRLREIFNLLSENQLPTVLITIINGYSYHDETINEFHNRIMNKLRKEKEEIIGKKEIIISSSSNIYNNAFILNLLELIKDNEKKAFLCCQFWHDLERFLFKWALEMRTRFADNDKLFKESAENIKRIMILRNKKVLSLFPSDNDTLLFEDNFDFSIFDGLVVFELFDHSELLELFINEIIDNKGNLKMSLDEIERIYCDDNLNNNNPFLKMMLIKFVTGPGRMQMLKRGWITDKDIMKRHNPFLLALSFIYSKKKEGEHGDEINLIETLRGFFLSQSMIKFFIDNNLRFRINNSSHLVLFLKRLEYIKLPKGISIKMIIKFEAEGGESRSL